MEPEEHLGVLEDAGAAFAATAAQAAAGAPVPTCPGWAVADLIRHLGKVQRWATTIVATPRHARPPFDSFDAGAPDAAGDLIPWFREGQASLLRTLREAPGDLDCWSFLPSPSPRAFWCRRQAHEIAMHLVDLALAASIEPEPPPPVFAADGVDELLRGWFRGRPPGPEEEAAPALRLAGADVHVDWQVGLLSPRRITLVPGKEAARAADCTVRATAADLYLLLWNRRSARGLEVEGDRSLLDRWAATRRIL